MLWKIESATVTCAKNFGVARSKKKCRDYIKKIYRKAYLVSPLGVADKINGDLLAVCLQTHKANAL